MQVLAQKAKRLDGATRGLARAGLLLVLSALSLTAAAQQGKPKVPPQLPPQASDQARAKVAEHIAPSVSLTAPGEGALYHAPAAIALEATAAPSGGGRSITQVEFFAGATSIGVATAAPYALSWSGVAAGTYSLAARATDNLGVTATSTPVAIIVNAPPSVSLTEPANSAIFTAPASITLKATATDSDGAVAQVEFFQGTTLIATVTSGDFTFTAGNVTAGTYTYTARATDDRGATMISSPVSVIVNAPPTVNLSSPANDAMFNAPASIPVNADAADSDGTIARVEFYNGTSLIATLTEAPYTINWTQVPVGSYSISAKVTDNLGAMVTSDSVNVTVKQQTGQLYFIHTDHLNTPRLVTNEIGQAVWSWGNTEPFGDSVPNENPTGIGNFTCNLRFPGQYFDRESNLHYNYSRDFEPRSGRYVKSDPIGLRGSLNTYLYSDADPVGKSDPLGLDAYMCKKPLDFLGGSGSRSGPDIFGNPFYHQYICVKIGNTSICGGQDREGGPWSPGTPSKDTFNPNNCEKKDDRTCMDNCLMRAIGDAYRPSYGLFGPGTNCQEWASDAYLQCKKQCKSRL